MVKESKPAAVSQAPVSDIESVKRHLDMLDQRFDNIDSIVTALVERVMNQPIILNITCSHCGKNVEISIMGSKKPQK